jgi:hypothetical protein
MLILYIVYIVFQVREKYWKYKWFMGYEPWIYPSPCTIFMISFFFEKILWPFKGLNVISLSHVV